MCSNNVNPYVSKRSQAPFDFTDITNQSLYSKNISFDKNVTFQNKVLFENTSDKVTFDNTSLFDNDIHVTNIKFGGDVKLNNASIDRDSKNSIISNAQKVNDAFTDDYIGGWKDEKYVIDRLKIKDKEDSEVMCSGSNGIKSKSACVAKMWTTLREAKSLNSGVCDCCCTKQKTYAGFCMIKLINLNGNDVTLRTSNTSKPEYYNITESDKFHAMYLTKTEGVVCNLKFFSVPKNNNDNNEGLLTTYAGDDFDNNMMPLNHFNLDGLITPRKGFISATCPPNTECTHDGGSFVLLDLSWTKWSRFTKYTNYRRYAEYTNTEVEFEFEHYTQNFYYIRIGGKVLNFHHVASDKENAAEDPINWGQTLWMLKPHQLTYSGKKCNTGLFWIVNVDTNNMVYISYDKVLTYRPWWPDQATLWKWKVGGTQSTDKAYIGVQLELESAPAKLEDQFIIT